MGDGLSNTIVPGWNPGGSIVHVHRSWFLLFLVFVLALRVFLWVLQFFSPSQIPNLSYSNFIWKTVNEDTL